MMRALFIFFLVLFAAHTAPANPLVMLSARPPAGGGGGSPDFSDDFEATGAGSWVTSNGTPNFDYTATVIAGAQSASFPCQSAATEAGVSFTASDACYVYARVRIVTAMTSSRPQWTITTSADVSLLEMKCSTGPNWRINDGTIETAGSSLSTGTNYHTWTEYVKGTGANGILRFYFSTDGVKPGSPDIAITNSALTAQAAKLFLGSWDTGAGDLVFDDVKISRTTAFGDNGTLP